MATRGAQTPTPLMMSPPGRLFIRRDDQMGGQGGPTLVPGRNEDRQEDIGASFFQFERK